MAQIHQTDFHEIFYWTVLRKLVCLRRTNTASATHKELPVCTSVALSCRL
jgi:hypothetical protein